VNFRIVRLGRDKLVHVVAWPIHHGISDVGFQMCGGDGYAAVALD
jgi:hypothetical protein